MPNAQPDAKEFTYRAIGRNWTTLIVTLSVWVVLAFLSLRVEMAPWLAMIVFLFTLPADYDLISARASGIKVNGDQIAWYAGKRNNSVAANLIDHIKLDTRLDLSVRCTLVLSSGQKVKVPFEACPKHRALEAQLHAHGYTTRRQHFGFV